MTYNKVKIGPLIMFLGFLIGMFLVIFVGVNEVFAAEYSLNYETYQRYYDNTGTLTQVDSTWNESLLSYVSGNLTTVSGSTGAAWLVSSPIPMLKDHQYSISFAFEERNNITLSSKNKIAISNTVNGAVTAYNNSTYNADTLYSKVTGNTILSFIFKANTNSSFIVIPWTTTSRVTQNYVVTKIIMEDLGSSGLSEEQLNSSINNQTNILNNSIQNSTNTITGEIDDMEQSIIDSNKETQDVIKDQFNTCRDSVNLFNINGNYVNATGTSYSVSGESLAITGDLYSIGPYVNVKPNTNYTISIDSITSNNLGQFNISLYNGTNTTYLTQGNKNNKTLTITTNTDTTQIRIYFYGTATYNKIQVQEGTVATKYETYGEEICSNKIDETNDKLDDLTGAITDSSAPNTSGLENSAGWLPPGPLDSILNLPLSMLNSINNSLSSSCTPIPLTLPFVNVSFELPCINTLIQKMGGNTVWNWLGGIATVLILYSYLLNLYSWVDKKLSLKEENYEGWGGV